MRHDTIHLQDTRIHTKCNVVVSPGNIFPDPDDAGLKIQLPAATPSKGRTAISHVITKNTCEALSTIPDLHGTKLRRIPGSDPGPIEHVINLASVRSGVEQL